MEAIKYLVEAQEAALLDGDFDTAQEIEIEINNIIENEL